MSAMISLAGPGLEVSCFTFDVGLKCVSILRLYQYPLWILNIQYSNLSNVSPPLSLKNLICLLWKNGNVQLCIHLAVHKVHSVCIYLKIGTCLCHELPLLVLFS